MLDQCFGSHSRSLGRGLVFEVELLGLGLGVL